jgi:chromosome segregation ATPase
MKTIKYLIERIEELAVELNKYKTIANDLRNIEDSCKSKINVLNGDIQVLNSIIEDQRKAIKELKDKYENNQSVPN